MLCRRKLELVIYRRGLNSLRFSYMMKGTGLTEFGIGTPRPQLNVSATLHHSAFDLASWDSMLLPVYAPIRMNFEALEPINIIHKGGSS